jgi:soluble lytic murein transglycosylase
MQKESLYQPLAVSVSDAMGLMQVVPQTALAISRSRNLYYRDGMLFEPEVALDYGAWYLAELLKKYDGQYPLAIAAYNAGPVAMDDWVARNGGLPMDEFVEEIPFDQARDYVKSVFALMIAYELAAGRADVVHVPELGGYFPAHALASPLPGVDF